jgi:hypothetical protein
LQFNTVPLKDIGKHVEDLDSIRETKRLKYSPDIETYKEVKPIINEVNYLVNVLNATWEEYYEE